MLAANPSRDRQVASGLNQSTNHGLCLPLTPREGPSHAPPSLQVVPPLLSGALGKPNPSLPCPFHRKRIKWQIPSFSGWVGSTSVSLALNSFLKGHNPHFWYKWPAKMKLLMYRQVFHKGIHCLLYFKHQPEYILAVQSLFHHLTPYVRKQVNL